MKTPNVLASVAFSGILVLSVSMTTYAVEAPSTARLTLSEAGGTGSARLTLQNPANNVWVIQSSSNLATWSEVDTWKVHNGVFRRSMTGDGSTKSLFYRAVYDVNRQDMLSTTETALSLPASPFNYAIPALPASFFAQPILGQDNTPGNNITTDAGAALGRVLFYDKRLSANLSISCASCHQRDHGFSDPRQFSAGFDGGLTGRNSMGLSNARWYLRRNFFWDERAETLEDQVLMPIQNEVEMGMTLEALTNRLSAEPFYTNLFANTFGTPEVTTNRIARALAQFVRSIVSVKSKYDTGATNGFTSFTQQENLGRRIFLGQVGQATCAACHGTDNFVPGPNIHNNGLEFPFVDRGLGAISGNAPDNGKFKVPSLRNIELTAPYMHDGRFATLEEVVEFYNSGVVENPNLSPPLRTPTGPGQPPGPPLRLNLTANEKAALVAFLKTLTDPSLATDEKYADPFNYGE